MLKQRELHSNSPDKTSKEVRHWSSRVQESIVTTTGSESFVLNIVIKGGAENGEFCWVGLVRQDHITYHGGRLHRDDILLEVQGHRVVGYTLRDINDLLTVLTRNGAPVLFKTIRSTLLTKDLRKYLNTRFHKDSVDHNLQQTIRDNLYMRTVPCTTRPMRPGEVNGVDYTFLSNEEFFALEKSGNLLESGLYDNNHYGTPKPPKDPPSGQSPFRRSNSMGKITSTQTTEDHRLKRNNSSIEALPSSNSHHNHDRRIEDYRDPPTSNPPPKSLQRVGSHSSLGPLPDNWEMAHTEDGLPYFIDHSTETTHWLDPRLANVRKSAPQDCDDNELPYGWEKVEDPHYGTYFIDHINRKTQYQNPVIEARQGKDGGAITNGRQSPPAYGTFKRFFTRDPTKLKGEFIKTMLLKGPKGFGFTIVGGDDTDEEFLQIKSIVPQGPAAVDGKLKTGDVLVYVNSNLVLGFTHQDVVGIFQTIPFKEKISLEVCRGYPLPFNPNDPNTEIITKMAVSMPSSFSVHHMSSSHNAMHSDMDSSQEMSRSAKSMPSLHNDGSRDEADFHSQSFDERTRAHEVGHPQHHTINIIKGDKGFGFTIADGAYGQKVKQILDRLRCKNLQEGDLLVRINDVDVKDKSHGEVVSVLKSCPGGRPSRIIIQRGGLLTPSRGKKPNKHSRSTSEDGRKPRARDNNQNRIRYNGDDVNESGWSSSHNQSLENPDMFGPGSVQHGEWAASRLDGRHPDHRGNNYDSFRRPSMRSDVDHPSEDFTHSRSFDENPSQMRYRSRTPGPDFMRGANTDDTFASARNQVLRSKTPTHELGGSGHSTMSGTPNFIPASRYAKQASPTIQRPQQQLSSDYPNRYPSQQHSPNSHFNTSQSYSGNLSYHSDSYPDMNGGYQTQQHPDQNNPRRQSTSFETEEPTPSNLTRVPRRDVWDAKQANYMEMSVRLQRKDNGFGFRIIGGTEENTQVAVGHIVPGGSADLDGRLAMGDEMIQVDNHNVIGASHRNVVHLMSQVPVGGYITISVRRRIGGPAMQKNEQGFNEFPYDVTVTRHETEGFGFVIISSVTRIGSTIGRIIENSPAERCGRLHVGDRILAVNGISISHKHHEDIVTLIKESGLAVTLTVGPPHEDTSSTTSQQSSQGSMLNVLGYPTPSESDLSRRSDSNLAIRHNRYQERSIPPNAQSSGSGDGEDKYYAVELHRGSRGFGFSIRGGKEFSNMALFVLKIADGGAADLDGRIKVGDQLIEINNYNTQNMTHANAIELISNGGSSVRLLLKRTGKPPPLMSSSGQPSPGTGSSGPPTPNGPVGHSSPAMPPRTNHQNSNHPMIHQMQHHPYPSKHHLLPTQNQQHPSHQTHQSQHQKYQSQPPSSHQLHPGQHLTASSSQLHLQTHQGQYSNSRDQRYMPEYPYQGHY